MYFTKMVKLILDLGFHLLVVFCWVPSLSIKLDIKDRDDLLLVVGILCVEVDLHFTKTVIKSFRDHGLHLQPIFAFF